jgi:hypothetical protein
MRPVSSFSRVFGNGSCPYGLRRHDLDLQTPVAGKPGARLGFVQIAFPYDAFVRFVDTLDPVGALTTPTFMALTCRWRSRPQHQKRTHALQHDWRKKKGRLAAVSP